MSIVEVKGGWLVGHKTNTLLESTVLLYYVFMHYDWPVLWAFILSWWIQVYMLRTDLLLKFVQKVSWSWGLGPVQPSLQGELTTRSRTITSIPRFATVLRFLFCCCAGTSPASYGLDSMPLYQLTRCSLVILEYTNISRQNLRVPDSRSWITHSTLCFKLWCYPAKHASLIHRSLPAFHGFTWKALSTRNNKKLSVAWGWG